MAFRMKAFNFRIHFSKKEEELFNKTTGSSRFVYNHILYENLELVKKGNDRLTKFQAIKMLPNLKKHHSWLTEIDSISLQATIEAQYEGFKSYNKKTKVLKKRAAKKQIETGYVPTAYDYKGHPKFKSRKNPVQSFTTKCVNGNIRIDKNHIKLPKIGWVRFSKSRNIEGKIKRVTVRRNSVGKFFVSLICEVSSSPYQPSTNDAVGIDLGLKHLLVDSFNRKTESPKFYERYEKRLSFYQRALARKEEGSKSWKENKQKIAQLHLKIKHLREDTLHKVTTKLVHENQVIVIEDLSVQKMMQEKEYAKAIQDASWSTFVRLLDYKAKWFGRTLVKVDRYFASSQICSHCTIQNKKIKDVNIRKWTCPSCKTKHDRDHNAAINILREGVKKAPVGA